MTIAERLAQARELLKDTEYAVIDARVIDDLIATARRFDVARIQRLEKENTELRARVDRQPLSRRRPTASEFYG